LDGIGLGQKHPGTLADLGLHDGVVMKVHDHTDAQAKDGNKKNQPKDKFQPQADMALFDRFWGHRPATPLDNNSHGLIWLFFTDHPTTKVERSVSSAQTFL
jgi:hypothetical protein